MALPKIIYDSSCPVCSEYMRLVKNKISKTETNGPKVEYQSSDGQASDFEYITASGKSFQGVAAIDAMAKDFPVIKDYMWMLPSEYKTAGLKIAYKVGSVVRKVLGTVKKGCNCGGGKRK
ncbi:MAG: hypothetical protein MJZ25_03600 [Fibrobacter sp.]|nr:hypothetical protein [Fibrobacter sp.]